MKRLLLSMLFFTLCVGARAQTGALTITNHSSCTLFINMLAVDPGCGNGSACDIHACGIVLGPGGSTTYASADAFGLGSPGFCYETVPTPITYWTLTNFTFSWTDASFQYNCTDCGGGGSLTSPTIGALSCLNAYPVWVGNCGHYATWAPCPPPPLANAVIDFY